MHDTIERLFLKQTRQYTDIYHGIFLIRGENVVLVGEISTGRTPKRLDLDEQDVEVNQDEESSMQYPYTKGEDGYLISPPFGYTLLEKDEALKIWENERRERKVREKDRNAALSKIGFSTEVIEGDLY